jgi:hypothetical protein
MVLEANTKTPFKGISKEDMEQDIFQRLGIKREGRAKLDHAIQ